MYDFGERLRELREKKRLSQAQVASRLNLSKSTISCYEANTRYPSFEVLTQLALLFNTTSDYLLGIESRVKDRATISVYGLTERQLEIINALLAEFNSQNTYIKE